MLHRNVQSNASVNYHKSFFPLSLRSLIMRERRIFAFISFHQFSFRGLTSLPRAPRSTGISFRFFRLDFPRECATIALIRIIPVPERGSHLFPFAAIVSATRPISRCDRGTFPAHINLRHLIVYAAIKRSDLIASRINTRIALYS